MKAFLRLFKYVQGLEEAIHDAHCRLGQIQADNRALINRAATASKPRISRKNLIEEKLKLGSFIIYQCELCRTNQTAIATIADTSPEMENQVVWGRKTSVPVQQVIAEALGYSSWRKLQDACEAAPA